MGCGPYVFFQKEKGVVNVRIYLLEEAFWFRRAGCALRGCPGDAGLGTRRGQPYGQGLPPPRATPGRCTSLDLTGSRYSPQAQIDASNFNKLELAWHFKTDALGARPEYKLEGTPLEVNGTVYTTAGSRRDVVALDARTGELKWVYSLNEGVRAAISPRQLSGRGVSYWTDGKGDDRIIYISTGFRLVELNAHTGHPVDSFGDHGMVDMRLGFYTGVMGQPGVYKQIDLTDGEIGLHSTPTVVNDVVLVGSSMREGSQPLSQNNTKGLTRAFDAKTGKVLWTFHNIPQKGEPGYESWEKNSADYNGNTGTWAGMTVDAALNSVYVPIEEPTNDTYGGLRPGNDLYGDSIVCLDLNTGKMKWYYQVVHHPIWNFDMTSPPLLVDVTVDGKPVKAVAAANKTAFLYVFDRVTGKPVWPMIEKPVPQSNIPGEKTSKTQPFPTKPAPYGLQYIRGEDDLIDFTPALRQQALDLIKKNYVLGGMFTPSIVSKQPFPIALFGGTGGTGGANWPERLRSGDSASSIRIPAMPPRRSISLLPPPPGLSGRRAVWKAPPVRPSPSATDRASAWPPGRTQESGRNRPSCAAIFKEHPEVASAPPPPRTVSGLPFIKPPYGTLNAIDLHTGKVFVAGVAMATARWGSATIRHSGALPFPRPGRPIVNAGTSW